MSPCEAPRLPIRLYRMTAGLLESVPRRPRTKVSRIHTIDAKRRLEGSADVLLGPGFMLSLMLFRATPGSNPNRHISLVGLPQR